MSWFRSCHRTKRMLHQTRLIGYWIEDLQDEEFCAPQEIIAVLSAETRSKLVNYLDQGYIDLLGSQLGYSWCRFFCGIQSEQMGSCQRTDGVWSWPEGLSHYVREHGIGLPDEFIDHVIKQPLPSGHADQILEVSSSLDYWRDWCASRRAPAFLARLREVRKLADNRAQICEQQEIDRYAQEEIARCGLGEELCIFAGCGEKVLLGARVCARHSLGDKSIFRLHCYTITPELFAER
jgi:hypothetical protein